MHLNLAHVPTALKNKFTNKKKKLELSVQEISVWRSDLLIAREKERDVLVVGWEKKTGMGREKCFRVSWTRAKKSLSARPGWISSPVVASVHRFFWEDRGVSFLSFFLSFFFTFKTYFGLIVYPCCLDYRVLLVSFIFLMLLKTSKERTRRCEEVVGWSFSGLVLRAGSALEAILILFSLSSPAVKWMRGGGGVHPWSNSGRCRLHYRRICSKGLVNRGHVEAWTIWK